MISDQQKLLNIKKVWLNLWTNEKNLHVMPGEQVFVLYYFSLSDKTYRL